MSVPPGLSCIELEATELGQAFCQVAMLRAWRGPTKHGHASVAHGTRPLPAALCLLPTAHCPLLLAAADADQAHVVALRTRADKAAHVFQQPAAERRDAGGPVNNCLRSRSWPYN